MNDEMARGGLQPFGAGGGRGQRQHGRGGKQSNEHGIPRFSRMLTAFAL
jgi:hypothetical protein